MNLIFSIFALLLAAIHLFWNRKTLTFSKAVEMTLLYLLVLGVGVGSLLGYYAHIFRGPETAQYIGWPANNPFQMEVGYSNLMLGILGILCFWFRGGFWLATALGASIWFLADAYGHIRDIQLHGNYAPGNAGMPLYSDIIVPILLLVLIFFYHRQHVGER